ncbi:MAG: GNAT family N-acetyltransferase [Bacteroidales bacterium]|nr:GNAT family N-acetyltransferase [Bacteroidales bacterium]
MMNIDVVVADESHVVYADEICEEIFISARERGTGIARRTPEYVTEKILAGKAVIAIAEDGRFAGFSYIETWGHKEFVANSGLIVAHAFRGMGIAMRIKKRIFQLSQELFPQAKIFSITTGAAVMKMNYSLGFRPVPFSFLTDDPEFWKGCQGCRNYAILEANDFRMCLCTGLLFDPAEHIAVENPAHPKSEVR